MLKVGELSDGSKSELEEVGTAANNEVSQNSQPLLTDPTPSDSDAEGGTTEILTLMQTMTKLLQVQTQAMAAQTLAIAVHHQWRCSSTSLRFRGPYTD